MYDYRNSSYFGSPGKVTMENLMTFYDVELDMMANELVDSPTPAVKSMKAVQIVLQLQIELADHIAAKGKSERALKSAKRLFELYDCIVSLNSLTGDLNTMQLRNREMSGKIKVLQLENSKLKQQLENIEKAEKF